MSLGFPHNVPGIEKHTTMAEIVRLIGERGPFVIKEHTGTLMTMGGAPIKHPFLLDRKYKVRPDGGAMRSTCHNRQLKLGA